MSNLVPTTGFTPSEHEAIHRFLSARTIPLAYYKDGKAFIHGTGAFYRSQGELFLITAAHVLEGINPAELGIPASPSGNVDVWLLNNVTIHHPKEFEDFDIAVVELLNPNFHSRIASGWGFIDESEIFELSGVEETFIVGGYPSGAATYQQGVLSPSRMLKLFTKPYQEVTAPKTPEHDILLKYSKVGKSVTGTERSTPDLHGVSGAVVYVRAAAEFTVWSPEQALRPVGIQVSAKHDEYIRVKKWSLIQQLVQIIRERRNNQS